MELLETGIPVEAILFAVLITIASLMIRSRNLFAAIMLGTIFSLLCTGIYTLMDAVDVAFTEVAVGAGVSTVLYLATLSHTGRREAFPKNNLPTHGDRPWLAISVVAACGALMLYGTADMPGYGDVSAPIHHHVITHYINESPREIGLPNFVTGILASYRGFDTFGETTVVFTAAMGVILLLTQDRGSEPSNADESAGGD